MCAAQSFAAKLQNATQHNLENIHRANTPAVLLPQLPQPELAALDFKPQGRKQAYA